jgi:hypothetical protein
MFTVTAVTTSGFLYCEVFSQCSSTNLFTYSAQNLLPTATPSLEQQFFFSLLVACFAAVLETKTVTQNYWVLGLCPSSGILATGPVTEVSSF